MFGMARNVGWILLPPIVAVPMPPLLADAIGTPSTPLLCWPRLSLFIADGVHPDGVHPFTEGAGASRPRDTLPG